MKENLYLIRVGFRCVEEILSSQPVRKKSLSAVISRAQLIGLLVGRLVTRAKVRFLLALIRRVETQPGAVRVSAEVW